MSSEIERLRDLEGFLKFASIPDWRHVALTLRAFPQTNGANGRLERRLRPPRGEWQSLPESRKNR
jgi:hypothetical protein